MNVPQLRFKGFEREYNKFELNNLCLVVDCQHSTAPIESAPTIYKMIRTSNVRNGKLITKTMDSVSEETYNSWSIRGFLSKDDVILTREAPMGEVGIIQRKDVKYFLGQRVLQLKSNEDIILSYYLYLILQSATFKKYIQPIKAGGSTVSNIRIPELKKMEFLIPRIEEQTKKINFFKLINSRIEKQQEKIEKLEQFKKGMMQKIFSQELRFKDEDGGEFPEWKEEDLGQIAKVIMGQSPKGEYYSTDSQKTVLIQGNADMKDGKVVPRTYTSEITKACLPGDIIMSVRAPVGKIALTNTEACIGRGVCAIRGNEYVYHYLSYFNEIKGWHGLSQGSTFESVSGNDIKTLSIPTPSLKEQEKISDLLTQSERKIEKEKENLMVLEKQKRGFMQGMFV